MTREEIDDLSPDDFEAMVISADPAFALAYEVLSEDGTCDSFGGMESRRVYHEWKEAGSPADLGDFIDRQANAWFDLDGKEVDDESEEETD